MTEPADVLLAKLASVRRGCMDRGAPETWAILERGILAKALQDAIEAGAEAAWERWASAVEVAMAALKEANGLARRPAHDPFRVCCEIDQLTQTAMDQIREKAAAAPMIAVQVAHDGVWLDFGKGRQVRLMDLLSGSEMDVYEKVEGYQTDLMAEYARRKARREGGAQ